jgi:hypothetical protein
MPAVSITFLSVLLRALRRARHFALVEALALAFALVITENLVCSGSRSAGVAEEVSKGTLKLETAEQGVLARKSGECKNELVPG